MTAAFHDVRFPTAIARGATGGPERRTEIVVLGSGAEERNTRWAHSRRRYNAGYGIRTLDELHAVIAFFEERRGRLHAFRWKDHADFRSCPPLQTPTPLDQVLGAGDGERAAFQLVKHYGSGVTKYVRAVTRAVPGTVRVAVAGVEKAEGSDFAVDPATGMVTFSSGSVPGTDEAVTAGFAFDVPVRFDTDSLTINLKAFEAGEIPDIALVEVRE
ncbi:MAG: TIGR02217 family protein [Parvibaculaceae bacterium]